MKSKFFLILFNILVASLLISSINRAEAEDLPDLIIESVTFDPVQVYPIPVIKNQGDAPIANDFSISLRWLGEDGRAIGSSSATMSSGTTPSRPIAAGQTKTPLEAGRNKIQYAPPAGAVKLELRVDGNYQINEGAGEGNNVTIWDVPQERALVPDLAIENVNLNGREARVVVRNIGQVSANTSALSFYYSGSGEGGNYVLGYEAEYVEGLRDALAPGEEMTVVFPYDYIRYNSRGGISARINFARIDKFVVNVIDRGRDNGNVLNVIERNYENNKMEIRDWPTGPSKPDLIVTSVTLDNDNHPIVTIKNQGAPLIPADFRITLQRDANFKWIRMINFDVVVSWQKADGQPAMYHSPDNYKGINDIYKIDTGYTVTRTRMDAGEILVLTPSTTQHYSDFSPAPPEAVKAKVYLDFNEGRIENESNKENNEKVFYVVAPDLIVESVAFDPTLRYPIITVKNQGTAEAITDSVSRMDYVWLNAEGIASEGYSVSLGGSLISVGQAYQLDLFGEQPVFTSDDIGKKLPASDSVKIRVRVDITDQVNELNEDNNIMEVDVPEANADNITYPVAELGNCQNREACRVYCERPENAEACAAFGANTGLMTEEEGKAAEEISDISEDNPGPGNCATKESCAAFCDKPVNIEACLNYAEKNNWMSADDLVKARKVVGVLKSGGATPGSCNTPGGCKNYCSDNSHAVECVAFGKSAGILSIEEAAEAEKVAPLMQSGQMPGGSKTREETEAHCNKKENRAECDKFFDKAGVKKSDKEKPDGEKPEENAPAIFKGEGGGPGGCKTKDECDAYCDSHPGECNEQVRQAGGEIKEATVPCSTNAECKTFCADPANAEACKNIVIEESPEEAEASKPEVISAEIEKLRQNILEMPVQGQECVKQAWGAESFDRVMSGQAPETPVKAETLQSCYSQGVQQRDETEMQNKPKPEGEGDEDDLYPPPTSQLQEISTMFASVLNSVFGWLIW